MPIEERRSWVMLGITILAYATYAVLVLSRVDGGSLPEVDYQAMMLWTVGGAILATIVFEVASAVVSPTDNATDVRDREIAWFGDRIGQSFVVIGGLAALLMALAEWDHFWIANVLYLCFAVSGVLASLARIGAYRRGF